MTSNNATHPACWIPSKRGAYFVRQHMPCSERSTHVYLLVFGEGCQYLNRRRVIIDDPETDPFVRIASELCEYLTR